MLSYRRIPPNKSYKIFIEEKGTNDCPFQFLQKRYLLRLLYSDYIRFCMVGSRHHYYSVPFCAGTACVGLTSIQTKVKTLITLNDIMSKRSGLSTRHQCLLRPVSSERYRKGKVFPADWANYKT